MQLSIKEISNFLCLYCIQNQNLNTFEGEHPMFLEH